MTSDPMVPTGSYWWTGSNLICKPEIEITNIRKLMKFYNSSEFLPRVTKVHFLSVTIRESLPPTIRAGSTTKGSDFGRMAHDRVNLITWGESSYHKTFDPTQKLEFPFIISGRADFKSWTSGLSWYHQTLRTLISGGVPWRIFEIWPR